MSRLFGTDGVRGLANRDITAPFALDLAVAGARVLGQAGSPSGARPVALVGRDTRVSGEFLEAAVCAGLASAGVDVLRVGVLPSPGVAFLTAHRDVDFGVMLSASHNPMPDNGIKFFNRGGHKLDDAIEDQIEAHLREPFDHPLAGDVGRIRDLDGAPGTYVQHLLNNLTASLEGLTVVLDCAEGAASEVAPQAFAQAGATVIAIHRDPDGTNINDACGSTHLQALQAAVVEHGADAGFAFDGDADRCLAVDAHGRDIDGDQIMAILAMGMHETGMLVDDTVVATVMSNQGFENALAEAGVRLIRTKVGDRYILEELRAHGYVLGGEQSGHVIMSPYGPTGDGTQTALHIAERMAQTGRSLADLAGVMQRFPQVMINVRDVDKSRAHDDPAVHAEVAREEALLGDCGRVLLRPSGTEPVVRVMVEAIDADQAREVSERLAAVVRRELAL